MNIKKSIEKEKREKKKRRKKMLELIKKIFKRKEKCKYKWNTSNNYLYITKEVGNKSFNYVINKDGEVVSRSKNQRRKIDIGLKKI